MSEAGRAAGSASAVATVLTFAGVMPAFGLVLVMGLLGFAFGFRDTWLFRWSEFARQAAAVIFGIGLLPAAAVGLAVARRDRRGGAAAGRVALGGLLAALVFMAALVPFVEWPGNVLPITLAVAVVAGVLGALLAFWLTRPRRRRREPSA